MTSQELTENHYDIILIGSGMGALTVASLMAQMRGKKVLVLERHFKAGGFTHDFKRQQFHWDVGVHYVGFQERERGLFDFLTRGGVVEYKELSTPITNEHFTSHNKGGIYGLPCTCDRFQQGDSLWTRPKTPLPGLYLTGADVCAPGIIGALMGGIFTLSDLPDGISFPEVYTAAAKAKQRHPPSLLQPQLVGSNHSTT